MEKRLAWAWFALVAAVAAYAVASSRYSPIPTVSTSLEAAYVWDRWKSRLCLVSMALGNRPLCSLDEMSAAASEKK